MKKHLGLLVLNLAIQFMNAQPGWQKGGNNALPLGAPPTIGTSGVWNSPLQFLTFGIQRMYINNGNGFIGIGNNFSAPTSLLHLNGFGNNTGQLFRSDGSQNVSNMWRIFTGLTASTTNEKARVFVDNFSNTQGVNNWFSGQTNTRFNHFSLLSAQGDMIFFAKGADRNVAPTLPGTVAERLRISAGNYDDLTNAGFIFFRT